MKITKIDVCDFRGFPGPKVYDFEFNTARGLFIFGENGSGKSSLFRGIQEFFNRSKAAKPFPEHKNINDSAFTGGHVTVHFDDGSSQSWSYAGSRQLNTPPSSQIALQVGCLDYRSLLETNFTQHGDNVNLFDIAVGHLVSHFEVPVSGGSKPIGELWLSAREPANRHECNLKSSEAAVTKFNDAFERAITPLVKKATELLSKFSDPDFSLEAFFPRVTLDRSAKRFRNKELILSVHRGANRVDRHHHFLNEARLSAIGLVVYLAGLLISVPPTSTYPKLLVLDDVLIGLDMANRRPVLEILTEYFAGWQIILLTHDKVWYEMVQVEMNKPNQWRAYELWLAEDGLTPIHRPRGSGPDFFLERAERHMACNDERAAAVYARAAFEVKVKSYCHSKIHVLYKKDPKDMTIHSFWEPAKKHALDKASSANKSALEAKFQAIDAAKAVVLNPLSHSAPHPVTKPEIQSAITAVSNLEFKLPEVAPHQS